MLATAAGVMYTCDAFGAHFCEEDPFDSRLEPLTPHFRFYYDCLMRPNARSVLTALRKVPICRAQPDLALPPSHAFFQRYKVCYTPYLNARSVLTALRKVPIRWAHS